SIRTLRRATLFPYTTLFRSSSDRPGCRRETDDRSRDTSSACGISGRGLSSHRATAGLKVVLEIDEVERHRRGSLLAVARSAAGRATFGSIIARAISTVS